MLLIGTSSGILEIDGGAAPRAASGTPPAAFLAAGAGTAYALTPAGALWARPSGGAWAEVHPQPVPDQPWSLAADPQLPGRVYIGVSPALLYVSSDGGRTWKACDAIRRIPGYDGWTFPPPPHIPHVRSIAADPHAPGAVYIGVEEGGVYWSGDAGDTWESLNQGLDWDVHVVLPTPTPGRLYATTGVGFHRSDDGGRSWRHLTAGLDRRYTIPLVAGGPGHVRVLTAAAATPPPGWRANGTANALLYASDDAGDHWSPVQAGLPPRFDAMLRWLLPDGDRTYAVSSRDVYARTEGAAAWRRVDAGAAEITAAAVVG